MLCHRYSRLAAVLGVVWLVGCAGNGNGLDANGNPIGSGGGTTAPPGGGGGGVSADFQSIQDNIFTPICTQCHIGASAPEGLQLDAAHSYALLVGVPSAEKPNVQRVKPGDAANSYIIQKLTGAAGIVGNQMPLNQSPLPAAQITAIQQWIANGAMNSAAASPAATIKFERGRSIPMPSTFAVDFTSPGNGDVFDPPVSTIVVAFNHDVDPSLINSTTLSLETIEAEPRPIAFTATPAASNPSTVLITPAAALGPGMYRVTVRGTGGGGALADMNAEALGIDYSFVFTVSLAP
jgi:Big-like domain-containing protein